MLTKFKISIKKRRVVNRTFVLFTFGFCYKYKFDVATPSITWTLYAFFKCKRSSKTMKFDYHRIFSTDEKQNIFFLFEFYCKDDMRHSIFLFFALIPTKGKKAISILIRYNFEYIIKIMTKIFIFSFLCAIIFLIDGGIDD